MRSRLFVALVIFSTTLLWSQATTPKQTAPHVAPTVPNQLPADVPTTTNPFPSVPATTPTSVWGGNAATYWSGSDECMQGLTMRLTRMDELMASLMSKAELDSVYADEQTQKITKDWEKLDHRMNATIAYLRLKPATASVKP